MLVCFPVLVMGILYFVTVFLLCGCCFRLCVDLSVVEAFVWVVLNCCKLVFVFLGVPSSCIFKYDVDSLVCGVVMVLASKSAVLLRFMFCCVGFG